MSWGAERRIAIRDPGPTPQRLKIPGGSVDLLPQQEAHSAPPKNPRTVQRTGLRITPLDIRNHGFRRRLVGYDPSEIDTFLQMVAEDYEDTKPWEFFFRHMADEQANRRGR